MGKEYPHWVEIDLIKGSTDKNQLPANGSDGPVKGVEILSTRVSSRMERHIIARQLDQAWSIKKNNFPHNPGTRPGLWRNVFYLM